MELPLVSPEAKNLISVEQAWYYGIIPINNSQDGLELLINDENYTEEVKSELELILAKKISLKSESADSIACK